MSLDHYDTYEAAKKAWINDHPGATPAEYERAMQAIAEYFGV